MLTPYELISKYVVLPLRILVASRLVEQGTSQHAIARMMGVSQAAVNKYVSRRGSAWRALIEAGLEPKEINALVDSLAYYLSRDHIEGYLRLLMMAISSWLTQGRLCELHRSVDRGVPEKCRVCMDFAYTVLRDPVLERLEKAVEMLLDEPGFAYLIPEVNTNIVECRPGAQTIYEVAGVPGRIARIPGAAVARFKPAYGASRHMARILIAVHSGRPEIRSLINIRFDEKIRGLLEARGVALREISGPLEEDVIAEAFHPHFWAVAHLGGHGIEPMIYIAGRDSIQLARLVAEVARLMRGGE